MKSSGERVELIVSELKLIGLSAIEIAANLGITPQSISNYINGVRNISKPIATLFEIKYGYRADWIMEGVGPKKTNESESLKELSRIIKQDKLLAQIPEVRDALPGIAKLPRPEYLSLVGVISKFIE